MNLRFQNEGILFKYIYWIIVASFLISLFFNGVPRVLINGGAMLVAGVTIIKNNTFRIGKEHLTLFFYLVWCIFSFVIFMIHEYPPGILLSAIAGAFIPILLAFCRTDDMYEGFFLNTYYALVLTFIISIILHFTSPQFYSDYLYNVGYTSSNSTFWTKYFFQGIFGVTALGTLSACASLFFLCKFFYDKKLSTAFMLGLSVFTLFLTTRRSAIAAFLLGALLIILSKVINGMRGNRTAVSLKGLLLILLIIVIIIYVIISNYESLVGVFSRVIKVSNAVGERNSEWSKNIESLSTLEALCGTGFGSKTHAAANLGFLAVTDGGFVQLFCELGIVGILIFSITIISVFLNYRMKNKNYYYTSAMLTIIVYLIQAIGSNVLEFQATAPLFWVSLGYCILSGDRE